MSALDGPATPPAGLRALVDRARRSRASLYDGARLQAAMAERGLDAVVAVSPANVTYTAGVWVPHPLLLSFVVTTASGEQRVVINEADEYYLNEYSWIEDIRGFRFGPQAASDALALFEQVLAELGLSRARIGIELSQMAAATLERVSAALPAANLVEAAGAFEAARLVKTPDEIELLAAAGYLSDKAIQTAFALVSPGMTEKELAAAMQGIALELGADATGHTHVHAGVHSTIVHTLSIERPIAPGEVIHVDFGAAFAGYVSDISRNAVVVAATRRQREIYARLLEIERRLIDLLRPGTVASELFDAAQREFARAGLTHPWGTLGHSIGLSIHEGFEFAAGSEVVLEPGMVVCVEPSHIEAGDARYHIEDTVVVTDGTPRVVSCFAPIDELFSIR